MTICRQLFKGPWGGIDHRLDLVEEIIKYFKENFGTDVSHLRDQMREANDRGWLQSCYYGPGEDKHIQTFGEKHNAFIDTWGKRYFFLVTDIKQKKP